MRALLITLAMVGMIALGVRAWPLRSSRSRAWLVHAAAHRGMTLEEAFAAAERSGWNRCVVVLSDWHVHVITRTDGPAFGALLHYQRMYVMPSSVPSIFVDPDYGGTPWLGSVGEAFDWVLEAVPAGEIERLVFYFELSDDSGPWRQAWAVGIEVDSRGLVEEVGEPSLGEAFPSSARGPPPSLAQQDRADG